MGDPTVLAVDRLPPAERARFSTARKPGQVAQTAPAIPEPHSAAGSSRWSASWLRRYGT